MSDSILTYSTAKGYVQSAYVMMASEYRFAAPEDSTFVLGFHMLAGFAAELYLKAYLSHKGHDDKELREQGVRHNLKALLALAKADGFSSVAAERLVDLLSDNHESFEFRYMKSTSTYTARSLNEVFEDFSNLDNLVDVAVGASASKGKSPGGVWKIAAEKAEWRL